MTLLTIEEFPDLVKQASRDAKKLKTCDVVKSIKQACHRQKICAFDLAGPRARFQMQN